MRPMRRSLCVFSFLLLLLSVASVAQVGNTPRPAPTTRTIAVLSAMTLEIETLGQQLTGKAEMTVQGIRFTTGNLKDRRVVLAHSGMGKVNAAMAATLLVEQFQPTHILFTGIAGGLNPDLRPGDVVIGAKTAYHDYGEWTPEGFRVGRTVDPFTGKPNPLFFPALKKSLGVFSVARNHSTRARARVCAKKTLSATPLWRRAFASDCSGQKIVKPPQCFKNTAKSRTFCSFKR